MSPANTSKVERSLPKLSVSQIRTDGGTQPRAALNPDLLEAYVEAMEDGAKFPPVDVFFDGTEYWLADGFHRVKATYGSGSDDIECRIHQGTLQDAQWFSFSANKTNGLYRSNADKQRCVIAALSHPKSAGLSDRQIAEHVGVSNHTISNYRPSIIETFKDRPKERTVTRNGTTYTQNVSNIGKKKAEEMPIHQQTPAPVVTVERAMAAGVTELSQRPSATAMVDTGSSRWSQLTKACLETQIALTDSIPLIDRSIQQNIGDVDLLQHLRRVVVEQVDSLRLALAVVAERARWA